MFHLSARHLHGTSFRAWALLLIFSCLSLFSHAQITTVPTFIHKGYIGEITVIFNPNQSNKGMANAKQCYAHTGITYNGKSWQNCGTWRDGLDKYKMTKNDDGNWELRITPDLYTYYGVPATTEVTQLCFVFNDGKGGNLEGKDANGDDFFVSLYDEGLVLQCLSPLTDIMVAAGEQVTFSYITSEEASFTLTVNGDTRATSSGTAFEQTVTFSDKGNYDITVTATDGTDTRTITRTVTVMAATVCKPLPEGIELGQNFDASNRAKVTLCTFAAGDKRANDPSELEPAKAVYIVGDFNGWKLSEQYQMYRDSCHFWLPLTVAPGVEFKYQYLVVRADGKQVYVSDAFAPVQYWTNNAYRSSLKTAQQPYKWSEATINFQRPDKNNLVIYELWTYDYTSERNFEGLLKRLDYIQHLGVNAIELMPVCEFDGDYNWGYSPNHYFAVDTQYGTPDQFRRLIDAIHERGMAVIIDMVFNHATGNNPQNKLYPYGSDLAYNPWFNTTAPHSDNVYEDWNHDFPETRKMFTRALKYWLTEYKVDGFRMDLSHGFCGKTYDAYDNICHYYDNAIRAVSDDAYFILEHWGSKMGTERPKLIQKGMLCWHNINSAYSQMAMGFQTSDGIAEANRKGYVSYCESHDEERNYYKAKSYGNGIVKTNQEKRISRVPMTVALNVLLDGPKMIWQFEELGYDYSINSTKGSTVISSDNRTSVKEQPELLGWFTDSLRMAQYDKVSKIINLRTHVLPDLFMGTPKQSQLAAGKAVKSILWESDTVSLFVAGNTAPAQPQTVTVPNGVWYSYLTGAAVKSGSRTLLAGDVLILTSRMFTTGITPVRTVSISHSVTDGVVFFSEPVSAQAFDLAGNLVAAATNAAHIDLSASPAGIYLLRWQGFGCHVQTAKIIKR